MKFGYSGPFTATARGLVPATLTTGTVPDDPTDNFVKGGPGQVHFDFVVPAGQTYARFSLFDEFTDGNDDLDLYVYRGTTLVGASGGGTAAEEVNFVNPTAGARTRSTSTASPPTVPTRTSRCSAGSSARRTRAT